LAAAGVLHLAFHEMTESGGDNSALARSIFFAARSIEAHIRRIETKLSAEVAATETPGARACTRHSEREPRTAKIIALR
jgi:hypothetical protein